MKERSPGLAEQGYAHAATFYDYVAKEAPGVLDQIKVGGGDGFSILQEQAPQVFEAAQHAGNAAATFVASNGMDVLNTVQSSGGNLFQYLSDNHKQVFEVAHQGASVGVAGAGAAVKVASAGANVLSGVNVGDVLDTAKAAVKTVGGATIAVAAVAINAVGDLGIDAGTAAEITSTVMNVVGVAAAAMPFLLPLQIMLKDIGNAVQMATYNKEDAQILKDRCEDSTKMVAEMGPKIQKITDRENEREEMLKPFLTALTECRDFLKLFCDRGFLSHMFYWKKEGRSLVSMDKKLTNTLQNLSMRVNGHQIDIQVKQSEKMNEIFDLLNKVAGNVSEPNQVDPAELAKVLEKAGAKSKDEIMGELSNVGFKLDEIEKSLSRLSNKMDTINDNIVSMKDKLLSEQKDQFEDLRQIMLQSQEETLKRTEQIMTLAAMKALAAKGGKDAPVITEIYSLPNHVEALAKRANVLKAASRQLVLLHPHGIGKNLYQKKDGDSGVVGRSGRSFGRAPNGNPGRNYGADGEDGLDGDDGDGKNFYLFQCKFEKLFFQFYLIEMCEIYIVSTNCVFIFSY